MTEEEEARKVSPQSTGTYENAPSLESLKVIGLISGGKDSFYSLLHCMRNGHEIVALGNLYPPAPTPSSPSKQRADDDGAEEDLNSFMYQTVGHTVIPAYETLTGRPLYRQEIRGGAVQTASSYASPDGECADVSRQDETESLTILLERIMKAHPEANAVCSGAILSTYQRTRIESVALRLGLVPLAYLWQYTVVRPESQAALLLDMHDAGLDARIVKVASGGLDERNLWMRVSEPRGVAILENKLRKFGLDGDGSVIGEGGEYETIVVGGPDSLFAGRIEVHPDDITTVSEGGGTEWLKIKQFQVVTKDAVQDHSECSIPDVLDGTFKNVASQLTARDHASRKEQALPTSNGDLRIGSSNQEIEHHTFVSDSARGDNIEQQAQDVTTSIRVFLQTRKLLTTSIISSHIILPSMDSFALVNKYYGSLFTSPNPPSRVTISCKTTKLQPLQIQLTLSTLLKTPSSYEVTKKALHVQSRSYWAPANIGPYSQAVSYPCTPTQSQRHYDPAQRRHGSDSDSDNEDQDSLQATWLVKIAGQIPLIPASMSLPISSDGNNVAHFEAQAVLSLQHLWRIGVAMDVKWFTGAVAYIPSRLETTGTLDGVSCSRIAAKAWELAHGVPKDGAEKNDSDDEVDEDDIDVWDQTYNRSEDMPDHKGQASSHSKLPEWALVQRSVGTSWEACLPPVFTATIDTLPRDADVEWHAFTGIASGATSIAPQVYRSEDFTIHLLTTSSFITHTALAIHASRMDFIDATIPDTHVAVQNEIFNKALTVLGVSLEDFGKMATLACVNQKYGEWLPIKGEAQIVRCSSVWDARGSEIAGFWVIEGRL